jgi:glycerol-3-phosphate dehydrogenase (NAD(P)+)
MAAAMRIGVVGAGAFGTALANLLAGQGHDVVLWARRPELAAAIARTGANPDYLPGMGVDRAIRATADLGALAAAELVLLAVPAQHCRAVAADLQHHLAPGCPVVICAKGFERSGGALMTDVLARAMPGHPPAVLSGPTFAAELARGLPSAVTLASADRALGIRIIQAIGGGALRPYLSDDLIGVQAGGAVKNVIAIACGVVHGLGLGDSARAALMTRGLAEMARLALALGGRSETLMGLSGVGDLALTCNSARSRNLSLGIALGQRRPLATVLVERRSVAEGVATAAAVVPLARRLGLEMPISEAVHALLYEGLDVDGAVRRLLPRPFRDEAIGGGTLDQG